VRVDPAMPVPLQLKGVIALNTNLGGLPAYAGNSVELLPDYAGSLARMAQEIHAVRYFVHLEYFIIALDKATEECFVAMEQAVQRGVKVRVLLDDLGSRSYPRYKDMLKRLTLAGIEWHLTLPFKLFNPRFTRPDLRNHRKIVVIDNFVGFVGSQNLIDRTYHKKKNLKKGLYYTELVARVAGPVVRELNALFLTDWYAETNVHLLQDLPGEIRDVYCKCGDVLCQTLPSGPGSRRARRLLQRKAQVQADTIKYLCPIGVAPLTRAQIARDEREPQSLSWGSVSLAQCRWAVCAVARK
jgi:cardiolipin synthase